MDVSGICSSEYTVEEAGWVDAWAVVADPAKFAARFNARVPGAHRPVTDDDIREMALCGLIGRRGFFERSDIETVRGVLRYEKMRRDTVRHAEEHGELVAAGAAKK
jgi:hypothetical protein